MQFETIAEAFGPVSQASIRCARIAQLEDAPALNAGVFQHLSSTQFVVVAQLLMAQLTRQQALCDAFLVESTLRYPSQAMADLQDTFAQFGAEEVSTIARELQSPPPEDEMRCVRQMSKLSDRIRRSLVAALARHWLAGVTG